MENRFHWADYVIFIAFLAISFGIGIYHSLTGGRQRTTTEFIMANRKLAVIPTVLSMVMSFLSAIMIIGSTAELYSYGTIFFVYWIPGLFVGSIILERFLIPWIYRLQLVSVFDYLEHRFQSKAVRYYGAFLGIVHAILYNGVALFAPSIALESVTGLSLYISLPVMAVVGTAYTALGGMRAVIWTDVFQCIVMAAGMLTVFIKGLILVGGFGSAGALLKDNGRLTLYESTPDPRERNSMWGLMSKSFISTIFVKGFCQASVQRYSATSSLMNARKTIIGNVILNIILSVTGALTGMAVFGYFAKIKCDPIASGLIYSPNQVLPIFVNTVFEKNYGFSGLFIATLYSGALSTLSSNLSGCAANIWEDLLKQKYGHKMTELQAAWLNKILVIIAGVLSLGISFMASAMPGPITQISHIFFGGVGGPMIGLFLLGGMFHFTNWPGALIGGLVGFGFNIFVCAGSMTVSDYTKPLPPVSTEGCPVVNDTWLTDVLPINHTHSILTLDGFTQAYDNILDDAQDSGPLLKPLYQISVFWYGLLGFLITMIVGLVVSVIANVLFPKLKKELSFVPDKYFIQWSVGATCGDLPKCDDEKGETGRSQLYKPMEIHINVLKEGEKNCKLVIGPPEKEENLSEEKEARTAML